MYVSFLGESNSQMVSLTEELSQKNEDLMKQQEEISQLLSQIVELQQRLKQVRNTDEVGRPINKLINLKKVV